MKTLHTLFIALGGLLLCASCDNYLDIKPKGVTLPEKFEDYERLLNHSSTMRIDNTYTIYITDDIELGEGWYSGTYGITADFALKQQDGEH